MDRIEPQRIDVEFPEPVEGVADEEAADLVAIRAVKVDGLAPRRAVAVGEVRAEVPQTISFGPEMVVHHVEHYGQAGGMSGVDQVLQCPRPAVGILHRIWEDAVVTPIARARELGQRHQLDRRHAEFAKAGEARHDAPQRAFRRKDADMQFVQDIFGQGWIDPRFVRPRKAWVDDLGWAGDPERLKSRT